MEFTDNSTAPSAPARITRMSFVDEFSIVAAGGGWAALYLDSLSKCEQVGTGDSPCRLGSRDRPLAGASLVPIARRKSEQLTGRASPHRARSDACDLSEQRGRDVSALVNRNWSVLSCLTDRP